MTSDFCDFCDIRDLVDFCDVIDFDGLIIDDFLVENLFMDKSSTTYIK